MTRFGRKLERASIHDALAVDLDQVAAFLADMRPAIAIPTAGILDRHLALAVFDHKTVAAALIVAKLDEITPAADTDVARRAATTIAQLPPAAIKRIEHG